MAIFFLYAATFVEECLSSQSHPSLCIKRGSVSVNPNRMACGMGRGG